MTCAKSLGIEGSAGRFAGIAGALARAAHDPTRGNLLVGSRDFVALRQDNHADGCAGATPFTAPGSRVFSSPMPETSLTLLDRLRRPDQPDAWNRFARLYAPLLLEWATAQGFQSADAEDLVQIVLVKLIRVMPGYERRDGQTFRGWLFTVCRNECHNFHTRTRHAARCPEPATLCAPSRPHRRVT